MNKQTVTYLIAEKNILPIKEIDKINLICQELGLTQNHCLTDDFLDLKLYQTRLNV